MKEGGGDKWTVDLPTYTIFSHGFEKVVVVAAGFIFYMITADIVTVNQIKYLSRSKY